MSETRSSAPARQDFRPVQEVAVLDDLFRNANFLKSLERACTATLTPARVISTFQGSLRRSPELRQCNVLDVAGKVLALANVGLEPDSPLQHAHLIPFKERVWNAATRQREERMICQVVFGYRGLLDLAFRSGLVTTVRADVVWRDEEDSGAFTHELGTEGYLKHRKMGREHKFDAISQFIGTGEYPTWAYAYATIKGSDHVAFDVMPWADIKRVRDNSPAFRSAQHFANEAKNEGKNAPSIWIKAPWVEHLPRMAAKTAFRLFSNWIPRSVEFAAAVALDEAGDQRHVDLGPIVDLDTSHYAEAAVDAAGESGDPAAAFGDRREETTRRETQASDGKAPPESSGNRETPIRQPAQRKAPAKRAAPPADEPPPGWDEEAGPSHGAPAGGVERSPQTPAEPAAGGSDSTRVPTPAAVTPFEEWLLDFAGDPVGDEPFTDPMAFARAALAEHDKAMPPDRLAFVEHNSGALANASQLNDAIGPMLAPMFGGENEAAIGMLGVTVVPFTNAGQYMRDTKAAIADLVAGNFQDWIALNRGEMKKASPATVSLVLKALVEHGARIGETVPGDLGPELLQVSNAPSVPAANGATPLDDTSWQAARNRVADMETFSDLNNLKDYVQRGQAMTVFIDRLTREGKQDVIAWMRAECDRIQTRLRGI